MIGVQGLLTVYVLFAVFGLAVLAALTVGRSLRGKTERRQPKDEIRDIRSVPLRPPPEPYPSKTQAQVRQPARTVMADQAQVLQSEPPDDEAIDTEIVDDLSEDDEEADMERALVGTNSTAYTASPRIPPEPIPPAASVSNAELRRWARNSGLNVADRGPIPKHVREAWAKANQ
jgi:hypothetical protein